MTIEVKLEDLRKGVGGESGSCGSGFVHIISYSSLFLFSARAQGIPTLVPSMKGLGCLDPALRHCSSDVCVNRVEIMISLKDGL